MNNKKTQPGPKTEWPKVRFGDIADNLVVRVMPGEAESEYYVGLEHLDSDSLKIRRWGTPDDVEAQKLKFWPGDIIFGKRRCYQRKLAVAEFEGMCSAHAMVLRAKEDVVEKDFLPFFMQSHMFMQRAIDISVGSLSPTINWKTLKVQEFPLPPKDEQCRIAEILWAIDITMEKWVSVVDVLNELKKSIAKDKFANTMNFKRVPLRDLTDKIGSGKTPRGGEKVYTESGVVFLRSQNIHPEGLDLSDVAYIPSEIDNTMASTRVKKQDVLLNITGASIGRCSIYDQEQSANVNQHVCIIRTKKDVLDPYYLAYYLQSSYGQKNISIYSTKGNREGLNFQQLGSFEIPFPTIDEQIIVSTTLKTIHENIHHLGLHIQKIKEMKNMPLNVLFGE